MTRTFYPVRRPTKWVVRPVLCNSTTWSSYSSSSLEIVDEKLSNNNTTSQLNRLELKSQVVGHRSPFVIRYPKAVYSSSIHYQSTTTTTTSRTWLVDIAPIFLTYDSHVNNQSPTSSCRQTVNRNRIRIVVDWCVIFPSTHTCRTRVDRIRFQVG